MDELALRRTEKINSKEAKLNASLENYKINLKKRQEKQLASFSKSHNDVKTIIYEDSLKKEYEKKILKKEVKCQRRLEKYKIHLEKKNKETIASSKRVFEIDLLRGLAIWGMIIDHYVYDFYGFFNNIFNVREVGQNGWYYQVSQFAMNYWTHPLRVGVRLFGVFLFIFLCGISASFAKSNLKRSLEISGVGLVITIALNTVALITKQNGFNVLLSTIFMIGFCLLIYTLVSTLFKKLVGDKNFKYVCLSLALGMLIFWAVLSGSHYYASTGNYSKLLSDYFFIFNSNADTIGWMNTFEQLNRNGYNWFMCIIGLKFFGCDWLGLFPYLAFIFLGGFVGEAVYKDRKSIIKYFYPKEERLLSSDEYLKTKQGQLNARLNRILSPISYPGRHTMLVYIFHQPVFILIMLPVFLLTGYQLIIFG